MNKDVIFQSAIKVIDCALNKKPISEDFKKQLDDSLLKQIYKLLKFHGFNHVLFNFTKENNIELNNTNKFFIERAFL